MAFILIGVLLIAAKLLGLGPMAHWSWWYILWPFPLAAAWWAFANASGLTQRRAMQRMDERKRQRREKAMVALGMTPQGGQRPKRAAPDTPARRDATERGARVASPTTEAAPERRDRWH
jgi:small Trp-rich protein